MAVRLIPWMISWPGMRLVLISWPFGSEALPFAVVGSYLSDWLGFPNERLRFKHRFLFHTLDDGIALTAIQAIEQGRLLEAANFSTKTQKAAVFTGLPLAILVSCQNGRPLSGAV